MRLVGLVFRIPMGEKRVPRCPAPSVSFLPTRFTYEEFVMTFNRRRWCNVLAVLFVLASTCVSAATRLSRFPEKPANVDPARWTALQHAVAATLAAPASTELTASDGAAGDLFGVSIALSGTTALVGAIGANSEKGAVYVFTFNGSNWVQQQELTASDGAVADDFGWSVALSGTTILVGAPRVDGESST